MFGADLIEGQVNGLLTKEHLPTIAQAKPIAAQLFKGFADLEASGNLTAAQAALEQAGSAAEVLEQALMGDVLADGKVTPAELAAAFEQPATQQAIANLLIGLKNLKGTVDLTKAGAAIQEIKAGFAQIEAIQKAKK